MEPKVCPAALLPLISHSFVLSLGGTLLLSFGSASRGSLLCHGVVAEDVLLGSGDGDFVRDHAAPGCFDRLVSYPCFVPPWAGVLGCWLGRDLVGEATRFGCLLRSGFDRQFLFFHGACGRGLDWVVPDLR
jgi:hypothetical protein